MPKCENLEYHEKHLSMEKNEEPNRVENATGTEQEVTEKEKPEELEVKAQVGSLAKENSLGVVK